MNKRNRVFKNEFKSGILMLDDPENARTKLFSEDNLRLNQKFSRMNELFKSKQKLAESTDITF